MDNARKYDGLALADLQRQEQKDAEAAATTFALHLSQNSLVVDGVTRLSPCCSTSSSDDDDERGREVYDDEESDSDEDEETVSILSIYSRGFQTESDEDREDESSEEEDDDEAKDELSHSHRHRPPSQVVTRVRSRHDIIGKSEEFDAGKMVVNLSARNNSCSDNDKEDREPGLDTTSSKNEAKVAELEGKQSEISSRYPQISSSRDQTLQDDQQQRAKRRSSYMSSEGGLSVKSLLEYFNTSRDGRNGAVQDKKVQGGINTSVRQESFRSDHPSRAPVAPKSSSSIGITELNGMLESFPRYVRCQWLAGFSVQFPMDNMLILFIILSLIFNSSLFSF